MPTDLLIQERVSFPACVQYTFLAWVEISIHETNPQLLDTDSHNGDELILGNLGKVLLRPWAR